MLLNCPECDLQISDKAMTCPHCGFPLNPMVKKNYLSKSTKRKRLPNGFGQITKLNNPNLRNPYRASVTVGKTYDGRCIKKILKPQGYFATYNEAYAALVEYNKNPYDLDDDITIKNLYDKWSDEYFNTLKSHSNQRSIESAWAYCSSVYNMRAKDIRARHIKGCMNEGFRIDKNGAKKMASPGTKERIKSLFNLMLDYGLEYEIVDKNYARTFNISSDILEEQETMKRAHISFKKDEIEILWQNINKIPYVDIILIQCYSGWRPQELGLIRLSDVDLDNGWFRGGMKTAAGKNRIVPIHSKIKALVIKRYQEAVDLGSEYLLNCTDTSTHRGSLKMTYDKYSYRFEKIMNELGLGTEHRAHDPRKHFITMAKKYKVDEYAIKYIVGHSISDITEKVYTERDLIWLKEEIEKII